MTGVREREKSAMVGAARGSEMDFSVDGKAGLR
jgi:hypothetical protein